MTGSNETIRSRDDELLLCEYLDGHLSPREAAEVERRLTAEPELREQFRQYSNLQVHLEDLAREVPPGFDLEAQRGQIRTMLERKMLSAGPRSRRRRLAFFRAVPRVVQRALAVAAAVLLLATVGWWAFRAEEPARPPVVEVNLAAPVRPAPAPEQLAVQMHRPEWWEIRLAGEPAERRATEELPAGTVFVSVGGARTDAEDVLSTPYVVD